MAEKSKVKEVDDKQTPTGDAAQDETQSSKDISVPANARGKPPADSTQHELLNNPTTKALADNLTGKEVDLTTFVMQPDVKSLEQKLKPTAGTSVSTLPLAEPTDFYLPPFKNKFESIIKLASSSTKRVGLLYSTKLIGDFTCQKEFYMKRFDLIIDLFLKYYGIYQDIPEQTSVDNISTTIFIPTQYDCMGINIEEEVKANFLYDDLSRNLTAYKTKNNTWLDETGIKKKQLSALHANERKIIVNLMNLINTLVVPIDSYVDFVKTFNDKTFVFPFENEVYEGKMRSQYNSYIKCPMTPLTIMYLDTYDSMRIYCYNTMRAIAKSALTLVSRPASTFTAALSQGGASTVKSGIMPLILAQVSASVSEELFISIAAVYSMSRYVAFTLSGLYSFVEDPMKVMQYVFMPLYVPHVCMDIDAEYYRQAYIIVFFFSKFAIDPTSSLLSASYWQQRRGSPMAPQDMPFNIFFASATQVLNPLVANGFATYFRYDSVGGGSVTGGIDPAYFKDWQNGPDQISNYTCSPGHRPFCGFSDVPGSFYNDNSSGRQTYIMQSFEAFFGAINSLPGGANSISPLYLTAWKTYLNIFNGLVTNMHYGDRMDKLTYYLSMCTFSYETTIDNVFAQNNMSIPSELDANTPQNIENWLKSQTYWRDPIINKRTLINLDLRTLIASSRLLFQESSVSKVKLCFIHTGLAVNECLWWLGGATSIVLNLWPPLPPPLGQDQNLTTQNKPASFFRQTEVHAKAIELYGKIYNGNANISKAIINMVNTQKDITGVYFYMAKLDYFNAMLPDIIDWVDNSPAFFGYAPYFFYGNVPPVLSALVDNRALFVYTNIMHDIEAETVIDEYAIRLNPIQFRPDNPYYIRLIRGERIKFQLPIQLELPAKISDGCFDEEKLKRKYITTSIEKYYTLTKAPILFTWFDSYTDAMWPNFPVLPSMWTTFYPYENIEGNDISFLLEFIETYRKIFVFRRLGEGVKFGNVLYSTFGV